MPPPLQERCASVSAKNRRRKSFLIIAIGIVVVLAGPVGCRGWVPLDEGNPTLELTSTSIYQGEIQKAFTCDGAEASLERAWAAPPPATQSFALIAVDRDSPFGFAFVHWVLYNLPANTRELLERVPKQDHLPDGSRQGQNDFDKTGYAGPCPPGSKAIATCSRSTPSIPNWIYPRRQPENRWKTQ
jgi:hypothetical protein